VYRFGGSSWTSSSLESDGPVGQRIFWPGPIPTFAISEILVQSDEERLRLASIARQVSTIVLPVTPHVRSFGESSGVERNAPIVDIAGGFRLPPRMDSIRGAITMAVWAVPRIDPWLDLLCASLADLPTERLITAAEFLRTPWWSIVPWLGKAEPESTVSFQECLWRSAIDVLQSELMTQQDRSEIVLDRIVERACRGLNPEQSSNLQEWAAQTNRLIRGYARVELGDWRATPIGKAIQLTLLRPDPSAFGKWRDDFSSIPPSLWWSGAVLCGLLNGYRRLPNSFRGDAEQQRLLAIYTLRVLDPTCNRDSWSGLVQGSPEWKREGAEIILSWSGIPFAQKAENARGQWFNSNFDDTKVTRDAEELSLSNNWACLKTKIIVPAGEIPFSGESVKVLRGRKRRLKLTGNIELTLPIETRFERVLDPIEFRRCVATEAGAVRAPKEPRQNIEQQAPEIPGLIYRSNFLSEAQELELISLIDQGPWSKELKRRIQHFGWRYDYKSRRIDDSMKLGPLPEWAMSLAGRLHEEGLLPHIPDQVIVNEYVGKQGIGRHIDCQPCFEDGIAMISLLESWEMIFRRGSNRHVSKLLEHGSVAIMTDDSRYLWSHEIPARTVEPSGLKRQRRVSVTFRKVRLGQPDPQAPSSRTSGSA
jgi:alkylated DNA repair dioxygenase AlkB